MKKLSIEEGERIIIQRVAKLIMKVYRTLGLKEVTPIKDIENLTPTSGWEAFIKDAVKAIKQNPNLVTVSTGHVMIIAEHYRDELDDIHIVFQLGTIPVRYAKELIDQYVEDVPCG